MAMGSKYPLCHIMLELVSVRDTFFFLLLLFEDIYIDISGVHLSLTWPQMANAWAPSDGDHRPRLDFHAGQRQRIILAELRKIPTAGALYPKANKYVNLPYFSTLCLIGYQMIADTYALQVAICNGYLITFTARSAVRCGFSFSVQNRCISGRVSVASNLQRQTEIQLPSSRVAIPNREHYIVWPGFGFRR